ncbi:MAG: protein kinase [Planctomycetes bacterium]|nr:protein kinase [Planctomycetota bacterium]
MSESEDELIGRWDETLAEAGPGATAELSFQPPGWGESPSGGGSQGLPHLTFSGDLDVPSGDSHGDSHGSGYDKTVQLPDLEAWAATQAPPDPGDSSAQTLAGVPGGTSRLADEEPLYTLKEVIGRGGMGVVYRAWQSSLQRSVAIKRPLGVTSEASKRRFVAEAVATGRLDHPNIVPIYDLGTDPTGEVVLSMKLVDGLPWKTILHPKEPEDQARAAEFDLEANLRILIQVCNAIAFAHSRQIVHNDLKPDNVMIGEFGEVLVMDWGLAVHIGDEEEETSIPHRTQLQAPCGTPAYMPPELADGDGAKIGPWTDVYLLGSILHELVTGVAPHSGNTIHEVIVAAVRSVPKEFPEDVPAELAEICQRAMQRAPDQRYQEAIEIREAIETYLTHHESHVAEAGATALLESCDPASLSHEQLYAVLGEAIARYGQALELWSENAEAVAGRRLARLRFAECALSNGDLGLGEAQLGYLDAADEEGLAIRGRITAAREDRVREEKSKGRLRLALILAVGLFVVALVAGLALLQQETERTADQATRALAAQSVAERAQDEAEAARSLAEGLAAQSLVGQGDALLTGGRPAEATRRFRDALKFFRTLKRSSLSAELGLLSARQRSASALIRHSAHVGAVAKVAFGPTGRIYTCGGDGRVLAIDPLGEPQELARGLGPLTALAVSPVGSWVAVGGVDGRVHLIPPRGGPLRFLAQVPGRIEVLEPSFTGRALLAGTSEPYMIGWDLPAGTQIPNFPSRTDVHLTPVTGIAHGRNYLWVGDSEGRLVRWNAIRGKFAGGGVHWDFSRRWPLYLPEVPIRAIRFAPLQLQFAFAIGSQVQVWHHTSRLVNEQGQPSNPNNFVEHLRLEGHHAPVTALSYVPATTRLVTGGLDGRLLAWDVSSESTAIRSLLPKRLSPIAQAFAEEPIISLDASPDGALVAAGHSDGSVTVWDLGLAIGLRSGAERSRQPLLFVEPPDPPAPLRRPRPRSIRADVQPPPLKTIALSPDGLLAASGAHDGTVTIYDAQGGRRLERLNWHSKPILALDLSRDRLLSVCADGWFRSWTLDSLTPVSQAAVGSATTAAVSSGGDFLALGRAGGAVDVFDARTARPAWKSPGGSAPTVLALSDDGTALLCARADGSVSYRSKSGASLSFKASERTTALALLADRALVGDARGLLHLYEVPSGRLIAQRRLHGSEVRCLRVTSREIFSVGADGSWQLHELADLTPIRLFRPELETVHAIAVDAPGRRVLIGGRGLELWDLGRVRKEDALAASFASSRGPERERALGRSLIHRGQLDLGLPRLAESDEPRDALQTALGAWELDRLELAHRALSRADGAAPDYYLFRLREALARERSERCSYLGRVSGRVRGLWIAPDGVRALSASETGEIDLWDLRNERHVSRIYLHSSNLIRLCVDAAGERFAISGNRGGLQLWQIEPTKLIRRWPKAHRGQLMGACFSADGKLLYTTAWAKTVRAWSTEDGSMVREIATPREFNSPSSLVASPDGKWLAGIDGRRTVFLWRTSDFTLKTWSYAKRRGTLRGLSFTPAGLVGFLASEGVWVTYSLEGELQRTSAPGPRHGYGAALDPSQKFATVVTAGRGEHPVTIWNLETGEVVGGFSTLEGNLVVAYGSNGTILLGGIRGRVTQWTPR